MLQFAVKEKTDRCGGYSFDGGGGGGGGSHQNRGEAARGPAFCGVRAALQGATRRGQGGAGGGKLGGHVGLVVVLSFHPTMSVTNLLATAADVRLECPTHAAGTFGEKPLGKGTAVRDRVPS